MDANTKYHQNKDAISLENTLINEAKVNAGKFEVIYDKYYPDLIQFIYYRTSDLDLASDICSEVFATALTKLRQYEYKGLPFSSWLYRIAINEMNQRFRKNKIQRTVQIDETIIAKLTDETEKDLDFEILRLALAKLDKNEMNLIELRFFEENSFKEIAFILNISENNAKVRTYRTLNKLKNNLTRQQS